MTFVHGPEEASFLIDKPAKLRSFVGYVDEFSAEEDSDRVRARSKSPDGMGGCLLLAPFLLCPTTFCPMYLRLVGSRLRHAIDPEIARTAATTTLSLQEYFRVCTHMIELRGRGLG